MAHPQFERMFLQRDGGYWKENKSQYLIDANNRLSITIRFFAGADPYDIMQVHSITLTLVYYNV